MSAPGDAVAALRRIAFLLERAHEPTYRVRAFRGAAAVAAALPPEELARRARAGSLRELPGVGEVTATCITEALAGDMPAYQRRLEDAASGPVAAGGSELRAALRGDCHTHSDWSDGGSPIEEMAETARALGHDWVALTDHSPRLTVARGLSPERLRDQLDVVARVNERLAPFRILTGIEVDINDDGTLDQDEDLLAQLDVVVASVHGTLRMPRGAMTERMVRAIANPHVDVFGHCTGRLLPTSAPGTGDAGGSSGRGSPGRGSSGRGSRRGGRGRAESEFEAELVFEACRRFGVAVEVNSRPERLDPPRRLLRMAVETGCLFSIDTDAHAPGQLDWQPYGCERAAECDVPVESVVNSWPADRLLDWTADHTSHAPPPR